MFDREKVNSSEEKQEKIPFFLRHLTHKPRKTLLNYLNTAIIDHRLGFFVCKWDKYVLFPSLSSYKFRSAFVLIASFVKNHSISVFPFDFLSNRMKCRILHRKKCSVYRTARMNDDEHKLITH